ncbi:MAG: sulfatase-like hydrolase/transferase [Myxococcota bacterium]
MGEHSNEPAQARGPEERSEKSGLRKLITLLLKIGFVVGAYYLIFSKILSREGTDDLWGRVANLKWTWVAGAIAMQLTAIGFATLRWRALLEGQGIRPSGRFLAGSIFIARFFGAFTPGGFTGFGGWRIYDVATHTGKVARATATIASEMLLGQVAFGLVVMGASVFGAQFIGTDGVLLVNGFFLSVVVAALALLARPGLFRWGARFLPGAIAGKVHTLVDAICAYEGKRAVLARAVIFGVGVHAFNNLIYVCAAQALGVELGVGAVFFASSLQIFATLIPASINGLGLREAAAVALYTSPAVGLPLSVAVLIPIVGFSCEMFVSAFGGLVFLARRSGYEPNIEVDDEEHEARVYAAQEDVPLNLQPSPKRGLIIGLGAGFVAGTLVGFGEGMVIVLSGNGAASLSVLAYGAVAYGIFCTFVGGGMGFGLAFIGRDQNFWGLKISRLKLEWKGRRALPEGRAYARISAGIVALFGLALGAFRIRRDVFQEELVWKSRDGLLVLLGGVLAAAALYTVLSALLERIVSRKPGRVMLRAWGSPVVGAAFCGVLCLSAVFMGDRASADGAVQRPPAPAAASNVLFIVVDTLRADHLPAYGYENGSTPNLDAFMNDAIRFDQAFANASWTRPSFASILTGRYPSNHGVMAKSDALPSAITTLPEALHEGGYVTGGLVTNFNVGPYYNFHQGFDSYDFLEPDFVLWADDSAAKLLLVQFLRHKIETYRARHGQVAAGSAYRDAEVVNNELRQWLDGRRGENTPFFGFVGYMDPHDPYYRHPYDGLGYSHAAHPNPDPSEANELRALYDGEITFWDEHFGNLIEDLKARGIYEDLTIIITADHGEEFCDHGGFWHGTTLYDEQIHVPLLVKLPGNRRGGTTVRHWVQSIDIMPTLLRQMGLEVPEGVQGGNLFEGTDAVYAEESHQGNVLEAVRERRGTDEHKLITANAGNPRGLPTVEHFRVDLDHREQENLAQDGEVPEELGATLEAMRSVAQQGAIQAETRDLDRGQLEQNCSLGYMARESCCEQGFTAYCD